MKILWVKAGGLVPPDTGGKIRSYNILRELARQHSVTFFSFYAAHDGDAHPDLKNMFERVVCVPLKLPAPKSLAEMRDYGIRLLVFTTLQHYKVLPSRGAPQIACSAPAGDL